MEQNQQQKSDMGYDTEELSKLKYVKVTYTDLDEEKHEIHTEVKFIGNTLISLYFNQSQSFYIDCPQDVILKFVTSDAMYIATTSLIETKKSGNKVYLSVVPPKKMVRQQNRKYSRVDINRSCVLVVNDNQGNSITFLSKTVNLSASGILICNLESMFDEEYVDADFSKLDCYHLVLFLETDMVFKLFARYVRHDCVNGIHRYAFHFLNMKPQDTDMIFKYVTNEQIKQLKSIQKEN